MTFYKNILLVKMILLCLAVAGNVANLTAQSAAVSYQKLNIAIKKHGEEGYQRIHKRGQEAADFDVPAFLNEHIGSGHIQIFGTFMTENERIKVEFDSEDIEEGACAVFCESVMRIDQMPMLGVSMAQLHDFEGAEIKTVVEGAPADDAGLLSGDVITFVEAYPIRSDCDLIYAIREFEVGEQVYIEYLRKGKRYHTQAVLAYQLQKTITWEPCCDALDSALEFDIASLNSGNLQQLKVYPNPSEGFTQLRYVTHLDEPLVITITDVAGREVYRKEVAKPDRIYKEYLDLSGESAGVYFINTIQSGQLLTEKLVIQKM